MKVAFVVVPSMLGTSFSNPFELFYAARMKAISVRHPLAKSIDLVKVANTVESVELNSGLHVSPDQAINQTRFDMVFIPALWRNPKPVVKSNPHLVDWIRQQWEYGAVVNATGTGVCFVAESGLLDEQAATTHWHYFDQFAEQYPKVNLKRQHFITSAGKLFCAASINAQTDLVLHQVHRLLDSSISEHLARHFSHEVRQPYDRLRFDQEQDNAHPDEAVLQAQLWIQNNLHQEHLDLDALTSMLMMSQRNFNRRFKAATGTTPIQYLHEQRLTEAKDLLRNSNLSIGEIAYRVGFSDLSYFTRQFRKRSGVTPSQWRKSVRAKLFR